MQMRRRETLVLLSIGGLLALKVRAVEPAPSPPLWLIERNGPNEAKVFMFPIGDAKDRSWFTPKIESVFSASSEIWFESPHPDPTTNTTVTQVLASGKDADDAQHSLFEILGPRRSARLLAAAEKYGLQREDLEHKRPWATYFVLNRAYWAQRSNQGMGTMTESPDYILANLARSANKPLHSEYRTTADVMNLYTSMPVEAQCERLEFLLDYLDDEGNGKHADQFEWIKGKPDHRSLDEMRLRYPALYQIEHVQRNIKWAGWIEGFLRTGGTYFIGMGLNHTLGPDSILLKARDRGLLVRAV
jgi:uncharacterized protein YbaP (TraB family)